MADFQEYQANHFPGDVFAPFIPPQAHNYPLQDDRVPPAINNGHWEDIPQPIEPIGPQNPHHLNAAYDGMGGYHPRMLGDPPVSYVFPHIGHAQAVASQGQANVPENQDHGIFGYIPQHGPPGPAQAAFPNPFIHRVLQPEQLRAREDNLRRLINRFLHHPDSQINMVYMEPGAGEGRFNVVIILEASDVL